MSTILEDDSTLTSPENIRTVTASTFVEAERLTAGIEAEESLGNQPRLGQDSSRELHFAHHGRDGVPR